MYFNFGLANETIANVIALQETGIDKQLLKNYLIYDIQAATEAFDPRTRTYRSTYNSKFLAYQVEKVVSKGEMVDWGDVPKSQGDITKWKNYKFIDKSLEITRKGNITNPELDIAKETNRILIEYRRDFEYGYKTDNNVIIYTYQAMALALVDLCALGTIEAAADLYDTYSERIVVKKKAGTRHLIKSIKSVNEMFSSGEWSKLIKNLRTTRVNATKTARTTRALEAAGDVTSGFATFLLIASVTVTAAIALISAIRGLITMWYRSAVTVDKKCRAMQEYLDEVTPYETNEKAKEKQTKMRDHCDHIAGWVEAHIIKDEQRAEEEIKEEDSREISPMSLDSYEEPEEFRLV